VAAEADCFGHVAVCAAAATEDEDGGDGARVGVGRVLEVVGYGGVFVELRGEVVFWREAYSTAMVWGLLVCCWSGG